MHVIERNFATTIRARRHCTTTLSLKKVNVHIFRMGIGFWESCRMIQVLQLHANSERPREQQPGSPHSAMPKHSIFSHSSRHGMLPLKDFAQPAIGYLSATPCRKQITPLSTC